MAAKQYGINISFKVRKEEESLIRGILAVLVKYRAHILNSSTSPGPSDTAEGTFDIQVPKLDLAKPVLDLFQKEGFYSLSLDISPVEG